MKLFCILSKVLHWQIFISTTWDESASRHDYIFNFLWSQNHRKMKSGLSNQGDTEVCLKQSLYSNREHTGAWVIGHILLGLNQKAHRQV